MGHWQFWLGVSRLVLYFLHGTSVLLFYIDVALTLYICMVWWFLPWSVLLYLWTAVIVRTLTYILPDLLNTLRPRPNRRHFADDIFKRIFFNETVWSSIKISLKFVPKGPINNIPALVQIMAWRRPGDKPLSKPMMVRLPTHICVTRPQWVNHKAWLFRIDLLSLRLEQEIALQDVVDNSWKTLITPFPAANISHMTLF